MEKDPLNNEDKKAKEVMQIIVSMSDRTVDPDWSVWSGHP